MWRFRPATGESIAPLKSHRGFCGIRNVKLQASEIDQVRGELERPRTRVDS